ncbi:MAG: PDZ domain-containing protein [Deltaproteobacteria bacterium]|nr:PDZ domain-containing protein [Deltaproteobacteria bacterium]MBW2165840.1 PDZ domain-containing protein [Deltaproteobacteria bacterium]
MKRYFLALNIFLIVVAGYFCIKIFYKIIAEDINNIDLKGDTRIEKISYKEDENHKSLSYYSPIIERDLLKTKKNSNKILKDKINLEALKHTDLKLRLWGTVTADDKQTAYAVIEELKAKKQNLYRVGDKVQDATVKMIFREKVVLSINGRDEILEIEELPINKKTNKFVLKSNVVHKRNIKSNRLQTENVFKEVNNLMSQANIKPYFEKGKIGGIILTRIKPDSLFHKMGLENGDIIKGVDGENIESVEDIQEFYKSLKASPDVQLQIKRKGKHKDIIWEEQSIEE